MAEPLQRTEIRLRRTQRNELEALAKERGLTVSRLVRDLLDKTLKDRDQERRSRIERRLDALARMEKHRRQALAERGGRALTVDPVDLIGEIREERDGELVRRLTGGGD